MADDAGEKMLTEERLKKIRAEFESLISPDDGAALLVARNSSDVLMLFDHIAALSATIKRLETERDEAVRLREQAYFDGIIVGSNHVDVDDE